MKIKIMALITILILCLVFLTGCYSTVGLETLAYAVAIGLDKGERKHLKIKFTTCYFRK